MQIAYPVEDTETGFWSCDPGSYFSGTVDDVGAPDHGDAITSPTGEFIGDYDYPCTLKLGFLTDPIVHTEHKVRVWAYKAGQSGVQYVLVQLMNGGPNGAVVDEQDYYLTNNPTEYSWVLPSVKAAQIFDYNSLYIKVTKLAVGVPSAVVVTAMRLEVPDRIALAADVATGTDAVSVRVALSVAETGGGIETFLRAGSNYSISDSASASDDVSYRVLAAVSDTGSGVDSITASPWAPEVLQLLTDPTLLRFYLVVLYPLDPATGSIRTCRFSEQGYRAETAAGSYYYAPHVAQALDVERNMYRPEAIGGESFPAFGRIVLINQNGELNYFRNLVFDGYRYEVFMGGVGFKIASRPQYVVVFSGIMERLVPGTDEMVIEVKDDQALLEAPVAAEVYEGTGNAALDVIWTMTSGGNSYLYGDMTGVTDYTIQAGDFLIYEHFQPRRSSATNVATGGLIVGVEIEGDSPAPWTARGVGVADQGGIGMFGNVDTQANDKWYERKFNLSAFVGKVIARYMLACEKDGYSGDVRAFFRNIRISAFNGTAETVRKTIWSNGSSLPAITIAYNSHPATAVFDLDARVEGGTDLAGSRKPFLVGEPVESFPVCVSRPRLLYQFHVRDMYAVTEISDNAYALTPPGQPSPQYAVDLKRGWVRLLTAPANGGVISGKVKGDVVGGYVNTAASCSQRLLTNPGPLSASGIDSTSIAELNAMAPAAVGLHITDDTSILSALDTLMSGAAGFFGASSLGGLIKFGQIKRRGGCAEIGAASYIDFGNSLNFGASDSFTIEFTVRSTGIEGASWCLASKKPNWMATEAGFWIYKVDFSSNLLVDIADGAVNVGMEGGPTSALVSKDATHDLAVVIDRSLQVMRCYIDGVLTGTSASIAAVGSLASSATLRVGNMASWFATGIQVDEFRLWYGARTREQIEAQRRREITGNEKNLLVYARMNGNANDSAGSRHGSPVGTVYFRGHSLIAPEFPAPVAKFTSTHVLDVKPITTPRPSKRVRVAHSYVASPLAEDSVAGAVSDARREFITKEWRYAMKSSEKIAAQWPYADDPEPIVTALVDGNAAGAILELLFAIYGPKSEAYSVTVKGIAFSIDINAVVEVEDSKTGTVLTGRYLVVGAKYNTDLDEFDLTIFRPGNIPI